MSKMRVQENENENKLLLTKEMRRVVFPSVTLNAFLYLNKIALSQLSATLGYVTRIK